MWAEYIVPWKVRACHNIERMYPGLSVGLILCKYLCWDTLEYWLCGSCGGSCFLQPCCCTVWLFIYLFLCLCVLSDCKYLPVCRYSTKLLTYLGFPFSYQLLFLFSPKSAVDKQWGSAEAFYLKPVCWVAWAQFMWQLRDFKKICIWCLVLFKISCISAVYTFNFNACKNIPAQKQENGKVYTWSLM